MFNTRGLVVIVLVIIGWSLLALGDGPASSNDDPQSASTFDPEAVKRAQERLAAKQAARARAATQASTQPAVPKPRVSADDVAYPPVEGSWYLKTRFPLVQDWFGKPPEEITNGKIYSIDSTLPVIAELRNQMDHDYVGMVGYSWIVPGLAGSKCALLSLLDGRTHEICLYYGTIAEKRVSEILSGFKKVGVNTEYSFWLTLQGFNLEACINSDRFGSVVGPFHAIFLTVDNVDWYIGTHNLIPSVAAGIRANSIVKGMTLDDIGQATANHPDPSLLAPDGSGSIQWQLRASKDHPAPMTLEADFKGGVVIDIKTWQN